MPMKLRRELGGCAAPTGVQDRAAKLRAGKCRPATDFAITETSKVKIEEIEALEKNTSDGQ